MTRGRWAAVVAAAAVAGVAWKAEAQALAEAARADSIELAYARHATAAGAPAIALAALRQAIASVPSRGADAAYAKAVAQAHLARGDRRAAAAALQPAAANLDPSELATWRRRTADVPDAPAPTADGRSAPLWALRSAAEALARGDTAGALQRASALTADPHVGGDAALLVAAVALARADAAAAMAAADIAAQRPGPPRARAMLLAAQAALAAGRDAAADSLAGEAVRRFNAARPPTTSSSWGPVADAVIAAGLVSLIDFESQGRGGALARFAMSPTGEISWQPWVERDRILSAAGGLFGDAAVRTVLLAPPANPAATAAARVALDRLGHAVRDLADRRAELAIARRDAAARAALRNRVARELRAAEDSLAALDAGIRAALDTVAAVDGRTAAARVAARAIVDARAAAVAARSGRTARLADSLRALGAPTARYSTALAASAAAAHAMRDAATRAAARFDSAWTLHPVERIRARVHAEAAGVVARREALQARLTLLRHAATEGDGRARAAADAAIADAARAAVAAEAAVAVARASAVEALTADLTARSVEVASDVAAHAATAAHLVAAARFQSARRAFVAGGSARDRLVTDGTLRQALAAVDAALAAGADHPLWATTRLYGAELLAMDAEARFARAQAAGRGAEAPDYAAAIAAFSDVATRAADPAQRSVAWFSRGELAFASGRFAEAAESFRWSVANGPVAQRPDALFRLGETEFELAARATATARIEALDRAAQAYAGALAAAPPGEDVYFLALFKLGWTYYTKADRPSSPEYRQAVETFARLVREYDALPAERQGRLALRAEAIDYMVIAFTQLGGVQEALDALAAVPDPALRLQLLRRTGTALRVQGDYTDAVAAWEAAIAVAPTDSSALSTQQWIVDLYQDVVFDLAGAQRARVALVDRFAPGGAWAAANPHLADAAQAARERALRLAAQYELRARRPREALPLYVRYAAEFPAADSAQAMAAQQGEAALATGDAGAASDAYARAAGVGADSAVARDRSLARAAAQNAVVAADSAWRRNPTDSAAARRFFDRTAWFARTWPHEPAARAAWLTRGRRAGEQGRWDAMAESFAAFAAAYPEDAYAPEALRLVADALFRAGRYADAQQGWIDARRVAIARGRRPLADSIALVQVAAAAQVADSLVAQGRAGEAWEGVYLPLAATLDTVSATDRARRAQVLRNGVEVLLAAAPGQVPPAQVVAAIDLYVAADPEGPGVPAYRATQARFALAAGDTATALARQRALIAEHPRWPGRAEAMLRLAAVLDSLGARREAAGAYAAFATAYPRDGRAADAQYNAAVLLAEAGEPGAAADQYGEFARRFPADPRAPTAIAERVAALAAAGDSAAAEAELGRQCASRPPAALAARCADRRGREAFAAAMALLPQYDSLRLVIPTRAQLTRDGVAAASRAKQDLLRRITGHLTRAIASGVPAWVAAASYHVGLVQLRYAEFLADADLPADLSDEERAAARRGAATQAEGWREQARETWTLLIEKATADGFGDDRWVDEARKALASQRRP